MIRSAPGRLTVAALFFLVAFVRAASGRQSAGPTDTDADRKAALMDLGQTVYGTNCSECHADGGAGRSLTNDAALAKADFVVTQILKGTENGDMSEFASTLTDAQIAAVATFIRNSFDNAYGVVLEPDVQRLRAAVVKKK
jgi:mono/diheme cytochrome c family protein